MKNLGCPRCKRGKLMKFVHIIVSAPALNHNLHKKGIRKKEVVIEGVDWDSSRFYCLKCGWTGDDYTNKKRCVCGHLYITHAIKAPHRCGYGSTCICLYYVPSGAFDA